MLLWGGGYWEKCSRDERRGARIHRTWIPQENFDGLFSSRSCYNGRMKPIAVDSSDFPKLRRNGCIYVDKTAYFHRLVSDPARMAADRDGPAEQL